MFIFIYLCNFTYFFLQSREDLDYAHFRLALFFGMKGILILFWN